MNYCSIEDAWKNSDSLTNQFKLKKNIENFIPDIPPQLDNNNFTIDNDFIDNISRDIHNNMYNYQYDKPPQINNINNTNNYQNAFICDDFLDHLETCNICRSKMRKRFKSDIVEKIENIIIDNKDTILFLLLILAALILCNLIISIFK